MRFLAEFITRSRHIPLTCTNNSIAPSPMAPPAFRGYSNNYFNVAQVANWAIAERSLCRASKERRGVRAARCAGEAAGHARVGAGAPPYDTSRFERCPL